MKKLRLLGVFVLCASAMLFTSCKKEVSPELKVSVVNGSSMPLRNATVTVEAAGADSSRLIPEFHEEQITDNYGHAYFKFKNTVLVTIVAERGTLIDSTFALLETKRTKEKENLYEKTIVLE